MSHHQYHVARRESEHDILGTTDIYRSPYSEAGEQAYVWEKESTSLRAIVTGHRKLPLVVKLNNENTVVHADDTPVDLHQPLLLYKETRAQKLHARNIEKKEAEKDDRILYEPVGSDVILPQNFPGYFKAIDSNDQPLKTVADLARYMPETFVSLQNVQGYPAVSQLESSPYQKGEIPPGLFHVLNVLEENVTYINKRKHERRKLLRCLVCVDENGKKALFPLAESGQFYLAEMGHRNSHRNSAANASRIFKWTDYEQDRVNGLRVRLIHGKEPKQECGFTRVLEFGVVAKNHTVIGCTMAPSPRLFEIEVTSEPYFNVASNSEGLTTGPLYQKCLKFIKNECDVYTTTIKVRKDYDIEPTDQE